MTDELTTKNTKNEILDAYHAMLKQVRELKKSNRQVEHEEARKQTVLSAGAEQSADTIITDLAQLKLTILQSMDNLGERLMSESKKFTTLEEAVTLRKQELENLYEIKANTDSLAALLLAQKEKKAAFELEMSQKIKNLEEEMLQKRQQWKKEQEESEMLRKETDSQLKKQRQREEEEYHYKLGLERKKDEDTYQAKKAALEKEMLDKQAEFEKTFSEREKILLQQENELKELRNQARAFPAELEKAVKETEKTVTERLTFKHQYESQLVAKENEGERKLYQQMVATLEAKNKEHEEHIRQLTQKANEANHQVQDIAVKAIEGASAQRYMSNFIERSVESAKNKSAVSTS